MHGPILPFCSYGRWLWSETTEAVGEPPERHTTHEIVHSIILLGSCLVVGFWNIQYVSKHSNPRFRRVATASGNILGLRVIIPGCRRSSVNIYSYMYELVHIEPSALSDHASLTLPLTKPQAHHLRPPLITSVNRADRATPNFSVQHHE